MPELASKQRERRQKHAQDAQDAYLARCADIRSKGPIAFMESLKIPPGNVLAGTYTKLGPWQKQYVCGSLKPSTRTSVVVCGRKNAKTFTASLIGLWHVHVTDAARVIVASKTLEHSAEIFRFIRTLCETNELEVEVTTSPRPGNLKFPNGSEIVFVSGNPYGSPLSSQASLILVDELGFWDEHTKRPLLANLVSCLSLTDSKLLVFSTRGDSLLLTELIEDKSESTYVQLHCGKSGADVMDEDNWHKANPGIKQGIKSLSWMRRNAKLCQGNPAAENLFRSLHLSEPLAADRLPIVDLTSWQKVTSDILPPRRGPVIVGADLGSGQNSFCSAAYVWPETGRAESFSVATGDLTLRGRRDGVGQTYLVAQQQGELVVQDNNAVDITEFMALVKEHLEGERIRAIYCDRYRQADMVDAMRRCRVAAPLVPVGQGFREGSELVRAFQAQVATGGITHRPSVLLALAISQSYLAFDPAGNPKLDKRRSHSKTDQLVSLMHGCLGMVRYEQAKPKRRKRRHYIA